MKYGQKRATWRAPLPVRGDKLSRACPKCGAESYASCIGRRSGHYTNQPEHENGGYDYRLKRPHKER